MTQQTIRVQIDLPATGANIRRLRREKGFSVIKIQELLDVGDPQTVYQWEWGRNLPTIEHLIALSILLETAVEKLIIWSRPPPAKKHAYQIPSRWNLIDSPLTPRTSRCFFLRPQKLTVWKSYDIMRLH